MPLFLLFTCCFFVIRLQTLTHLFQVQWLSDQCVVVYSTVWSRRSLSWRLDTPSPTNLVFMPHKPRNPLFSSSPGALLPPNAFIFHPSLNHLSLKNALSLLTNAHMKSITLAGHFVCLNSNKTPQISRFSPEGVCFQSGVACGCLALRPRWWALVPELPWRSSSGACHGLFYCVNNLILASGMGLNPYQTRLSDQTNESMVY